MAKSWDHGANESRHRRGYGRQHVALRAQLLADEPLCRMCKAKGKITAATIADHIVPIAKLPPGAPLYDIRNLQPVCGDCHDAKTRADNNWRPARKRIGADGWPVDD